MRVSCGDSLAEAFGNSQTRTAGARISRGFVLVGLDGLADEPQFGARMRRHVGQSRIHRVRQGMAAHELLDHAVLERMKADHGQAAAGGQAGECGIERGFVRAEPLRGRNFRQLDSLAILAIIQVPFTVCSKSFLALSGGYWRIMRVATKTPPSDRRYLAE